MHSYFYGKEKTFKNVEKGFRVARKSTETSKA